MDFELDLVDVAAAVLIAFGFLALAVVIFWPLERDDVMQRVHGDQPNPPELEGLPQ
jgi:hypothetical protein